MSLYSTKLKPEDQWNNAQLFVECAFKKATSLYLKDQKVQKASLFHRIFAEISMVWNDNHLEDLQQALKACILYVDKEEKIETNEKNQPDHQILKQKLQHFFRNTPAFGLFHSIKPVFSDTDNERLSEGWKSGSEWVVDTIQSCSDDLKIHPVVLERDHETRFFFPLSISEKNDVALSKQNEKESNPSDFPSVYEAQAVNNAEVSREHGYNLFLLKLRFSKIFQKFPFLFRIPLIKKLATPYFSKKERKHPNEEIYKGQRDDPLFTAQAKPTQLKVTFLGGSFCLIQHQFQGRNINILTDPVKGKISQTQKRMIDEIPLEKLPKIDLILLSNPQQIDLPTLKMIVRDKPLVVLPWSRKSHSAYLKETLERCGFERDYSRGVVECKWGDKITLSYGMEGNSLAQGEKVEIYALYAKALSGRNKKDFNLSMPLTYAIGLPHDSPKRPFVHFFGHSAPLFDEMNEQIGKIFERGQLVLSLQSAASQGFIRGSYNPQSYYEAIYSHLRGSCPTLAINRGLAQMTSRDTFSEGVRSTIEKISKTFSDCINSLKSGKMFEGKSEDLTWSWVKRIYDLYIQKKLFPIASSPNRMQSEAILVDDDSLREANTEDFEKTLKEYQEALTFFQEKMEKDQKQAFHIPKIYESLEIPLIDS